MLVTAKSSTHTSKENITSSLKKVKNSKFAIFLDKEDTKHSADVKGFYL